MIPLERLQAGLVIPIDKPLQWTSFQAVNKVKSTIRRLYNIKNIKIGHAGTLDPLATGLLLVCVGKATKSIEQLQGGVKEYSGTLVLGASTPCHDLEQAVDRLYPTDHISAERVEEVRRTFLGDIEQVPPMFSAVKIDGQRAYTYARKDDPDAVIEPKRVHIESFELTPMGKTEESAVQPEQTDNAQSVNRLSPHHYDHPQGVVPAGLPLYGFRVLCGKGTYIRSLVRDMGAALDSGALLASLRRERVGDFRVENAVQLSDIEAFLVNGE